ncbi:HTTM domain-containing protein [uncultured Maribacter sp.]|uniref:HTTM domain-containing protein n=1 Tax=uncultured Maribacter sp. TaxID=431308 RepID=UPI0026183AB7|nr:HTTM domain-containing protein [uncultured Maribacter sp.]
MEINAYLNRKVSSSSLVVFRIGFGIMMCLSIVRFWLKGWIETLYISPKFHFKYFGFEWVKTIGDYTYLLFLLCGISAFFVAIGYKYRLSIVMFFLSFTYIELMDKTTYLNHYYFISITSFLMCFLPANVSFSIDAIIAKKEYKKVPKWTVDSLKLVLGIVYFYAGLAKINSDWLYKAMPLKIWLPSKYDLPILGETLMQENWFHFAMSWSGMLYDLLIPFLLLYKRTRILAFVLVVFFHVFTRVLFPIGMFPYIMIIGAIIFFDSEFHNKIITIIKKLLKPINNLLLTSNISVNRKKAIKPYKKSIVFIVGLFLVFQLLFPWRYLLYPGELFWTEEGYRFSWRVMLMEKMGIANFKIVDAETKKFFYVDNSDFLTPLQEKQMSFQPDFILEYAHFLGNHFTKQGYENVQVFVDCYVALNGRLSQPFIDKEVNLYKEKELFKHKQWILPFNDEIKGL